MAENKQKDQALKLNEREFLEGFAAVAGTSSVMAALDGWGNWYGNGGIKD